MLRRKPGMKRLMGVASNGLLEFADPSVEKEKGTEDQVESEKRIIIHIQHYFPRFTC